MSRLYSITHDVDDADVVALFGDVAGVSDVNSDADSDDDVDNVDDCDVVGVDCVIVDVSVYSKADGDGCDR